MVTLPELSFGIFLLVSLASYRITRFIVFDSLIGADLGSGSRFSIWLTQFAYNSDGTDRSWARGKIGDLLNCPWCTGFWVSVAVTAWWVFLPAGALWFLVPWAVAGTQGLLTQLDIFFTETVSEDE